jgi:hypothetical protein
LANIINRSKASQHPTPPGGIYVGIVKAVNQQERPFVTIPKLGVTVGPLRVLNARLGKPLAVGTQVLCAYTNASNTEMYVMGEANPSADDGDLSASSIIATQVFG